MRYKIIGAPTKFNNWTRPLFRTRTDHARNQKPNQSRKTVPLNIGKMKLSHHMQIKPVEYSIRKSTHNVAFKYRRSEETKLQFDNYWLHKFICEHK